ncbi:MAG: beta-propeller domain-containing protein [Geodermatophilaceae bacterium]|nr:beta-propeller domain-containing protein [Geodermatophilaceae bacterium]
MTASVPTESRSHHPSRRPAPLRRLGVRAGVATALGIALVVVVPGGLGGGDGTASAASLTLFEDCDELAGWFADSARDLVGPYGFQGVGMQRWGGPDVDVAAPASEESATGSAPTGTNVQEEGVDEPDLLKTDGTRVVAVRGDRLSVVEVSSGSPRILGQLRLDSGHAEELLLVDDRVLLFGSNWDEPEAAAATILTVVDLSDPTRPAVLRTESIEGSYLSAREHDGAVRVVLTSNPNLPFVFPEGDLTDDEAALQNRAIVEAAPAQSWLPQRAVYDSDGDELGRGALLDCDQISRPAEPAGIGVLTVLTFDLRAPDAPMSEPLAVAADGDMVYASTDRLYVATTRGGWMFPPPVDTFQRWLPGGEQIPVTTELHGFDISDRSATAYLGSGSVDGWLLGRWALSAAGGYLRVATTRDGVPEQGGTDSAVTVLAEDGAELTVVGSVGGLGRGEQIRAVRWFGDLATVVTFQQTDPLYTVDLSDPTSPQVLGELKVTGYSAYLHPLGDGLLLGVGQEATETGTVTGAKIATFDLTDLASPSMVDSVVEPDAWAEVESDSRAFTYLPEERLAVTQIGTGGGSALWSVAIRPDGTLGASAQWSTSGEAWLARAIPVGGRMVALTDGSNGAVLTVLDLDGLRPLDSVRLG